MEMVTKGICVRGRTKIKLEPYVTSHSVRDISTRVRHVALRPSELTLMFSDAFLALSPSLSDPYTA